MNEIKVLYKKNYFERDLYLLSINNKYTKVYRSSGLNGGRKGRFLPFLSLQDTPPRFSEAMQGIKIGWIQKYFYYNGQIHNHHKNMIEYGSGVQELLKEIELFLEDSITDIVEFSEINFEPNNLIKVVKDINNDMEQIISDNNLEIFDWYYISNNIPIDKNITDYLDSLESTLNRRARAMYAVETYIENLELDSKTLKLYLPHMEKRFFISKDGVIMIRKYLFGDPEKASEYKIENK